jgi:asparagine synthase (glutamine-hydrolysing)
VCGIFATTRPDLWSDQRGDVLAALSHRGPDGSGWWDAPGGGAALGHTRLAIIGLGEPGAQPLTSSDGSVTITYNGELYNYRELGGRAAASDTAVFADLLARVGVAGLERVRGMYAFAAWDRRDGGRLIVGRDRFGIKPLYVLRHEGGGVSVASELRPLLLLPEARAIDATGLAQYLSYGHTGPVLTVYRRIRKVAPGVALSWRPGQPGDAPQSAHVGAWPVDGAASDVAAMVDDTVAAHLVADVDVGVFLSGGTDSTLLAVAAAGSNPNLHTFTLAFPDRPDIDESPIASHNAARIGTRHRTVPLRSDDLAGAARDVVAAHGEPFGDAASLPLLLLARAASEHVKVVLTGEGADEVFGGYRRYDISRQLDRRVVRWSRPLGRRVAPRVARWRTDRPRDRAIEAACWGGGHRSHAALLGADVTALVATAPAFADVDAIARADWDASRDGDEARQARAHDLARWLPNTYLEKADRATMAAGLEARVPYLDPAVLAYVRATGRFGKGDLRAELGRRLPDPAAPDRKKGLAVDLVALNARPELTAARRHALESTDGVVRTAFGHAVASALAARATRSPTTAYRLAIAGMWDEWRPRE